jgi:V-type H+-transporting ATPase subunit E
MAQQITKSNITNKSRLRVLAARQEILDNIFEEARGRLGEIAKDKKKYGVLLKNLILEGLYAIMDREVFVRARKADGELVERAMKEANEEFEKEAGYKCDVELDTDSPLPAERYEHPFLSVFLLLMGFGC